MSTAGRVGKNYIYNVFYQLLTILSPLITTPYISHVLGEKGIGAYSWTQSISETFLLIAAFGINVYGQREIARCQTDVYRRSRLLEELMLMRGIAVLPCFFIYVYIFRALGRFPELFWIQSLGFLTISLDTSFFLLGMEDFRDLMTKNAAIKILSIAAIFLFVKKPSDVMTYALCFTVTSLLGSLCILVKVRHFIRYVPLCQLRVFPHFRRSFAFLLPEIAIHIYSVMDRAMLGFLYSDIGENGFYTQGQKIIKVSLAVVTSMGTVMLPRMSNAYANKNNEQIGRYLSVTVRFAVFMGTGIAMGLCGIAGGLVPWFFGSGFEPVVKILYLLGLSILPISLSNVTGLQCLIPFGMQKEFNTSVIAGALCNLTVNCLLIPKYGAAGACIGTILSEYLVTGIQWHFVRKQIRLEGVGMSLVRSLAAGTVMLAVLMGSEKLMPVSIASTIAQIAMGGVVYILLLFIMQDVFAKWLIGTLRTAVRQRFGKG